MRRRHILVTLVGLTCTLAACGGGGGGGKSAADLEKQVIDSDTQFQNDDPVVKAHCDSGLGKGDNAVAHCTSTSRSGARFKVTVRNRSGGLAFDSVEVPTESKLERRVRGLHDDFYVTKKGRSELKSKSVDCATPTRCEVTVTIGAVYGYDVAGDNVHSQGGHWTGDAMAYEILTIYKKQPKFEGARVVCPSETPFVIGGKARCEATLSDDEKLTINVKITSDETGDFDTKY